VNAGDEHEAAGDVVPRFPEPRHLGRESALQMLYQWEVGRTGIDEVVETYWELERPDAAAPSEGLKRFATALALGTVQQVAEIDPLIAASAEHWRLPRMAAIDRAILRLAVYEFLHLPDTPPNVVINEALELAKTFSTDDAVRFVNGILDAVKRRLEDENPDAPGA